ncbi:MAG: NB-ARC domain-containing protein, partial [Blastocatellia bacterium]
MPIIETILGHLSAYIFTGVTGNTSYDLLKTLYEKSANKSWEDLYIDAFQTAVEQFSPSLPSLKGVTPDREAIAAILRQDVGEVIEGSSYTTLQSVEFSQRLARALEPHIGSIAGGRILTQEGAANFIDHLTGLVKRNFREAIINNQQAFNRALLDELADDHERLQSVQIFLRSQFDLTLDRLDNIDIGVRGLRDLILSQSKREQEGIARDERESAALISKLPLVDTSHFTGRAEEIKHLAQILIGSDIERVAGVWGGPGVGKTTLARYFAEQRAADFPAGIFTQSARGRDARDLALSFASLIGWPVDPEEEGDLEAATIMRLRFSGRRSLLIIDDAAKWDIGQLLPGGDCAVLITTRDRELFSYINLQPSAFVELRTFQPEQSLAFLAEMIGSNTVQAEGTEAGKLVEMVGHLPLALRIVGAHLRRQEFVPQRIGRYVKGLERERDVIQRLRWDDPNAPDVLAVFRLSRDQLHPDALHTFASLSACVEDGFGLAAAVATAGVDESLAAEHLARLISLALLEWDRNRSRFYFHPLLREFAAAEASDLEVEVEAEARHAKHFTVYVRERQVLTAERLADLQTEQAAILQTAQWKLAQGELDVAFWLGLRHLLQHRGHWQKSMGLMRGYLRLAEERGQDEIVAHFHLQLGKYELLQGHFDNASTSLLKAAENFAAIGELRGEAMTLNSLGGALQAKGQFDRAIECYERSQEIGERLKDERSVAMVLNSLGGALQAKGQFDRAIEYYERSL